jgi:hypothetical protein
MLAACSYAEALNLAQLERQSGEATARRAETLHGCTHRMAVANHESAPTGALICDPHHHLWEYPTSRYLRESSYDIDERPSVLKTVHISVCSGTAPPARRRCGRRRDRVHTEVAETDEAACG